MNAVYAPTTWRLLISPPADGATNMATDEAIVRAVAAGLVAPTLRLYAWQPPCLSLGRAQPGDEVNRAACARDGVHVVRRPTGGRAILHTDELTYSVIAPSHEPRLTGDILTSYRRLSHALRAALQHLNINANPQSPTTVPPFGAKPLVPRSRAGGSGTPNPVCFQSPSHYELTTPDGRKLVGSAQMRKQNVVLQHGTLALVGDIARICRYLTKPPEPQRVRARAATLESALGRPVSWEEAAAAMSVGFNTALNLTLIRGELKLEQEWIGELRIKYADDEWTWQK